MAGKTLMKAYTILQPFHISQLLNLRHSYTFHILPLHQLHLLPVLTIQPNPTPTPTPIHFPTTPTPAPTTTPTPLTLNLTPTHSTYSYSYTFQLLLLQLLHQLSLQNLPSTPTHTPTTKLLLPLLHIHNPLTLLHSHILNPFLHPHHLLPLLHLQTYNYHLLILPLLQLHQHSYSLSYTYRTHFFTHTTYS